MPGDRAILTLGTAAYAVSEFDTLRERYHIDSIPVAALTSHADAAAAIADAVAARSAAGKSPYVAFIRFFRTSVFYPFDADMFSPLTESGCRVFCGAAIGHDNVDMDWLTSQGAYYCNTPALTVSTAHTALMLILAATRAASQGDMYARAGNWRGDASLSGGVLPLGEDIEGMTLGIIGLGAIGKALAVRSQACGMKIIYHNRRRVPESEENGATYVSMDELLATSDVISVNCPLTAETRHLLGHAEFSKMKTGVFIVNTARGPIIDETALIQALKSGKVSRAGLDVFENEPNPHMAANTRQAFTKGELELFASVEEFMRGERPKCAVNDPKM
ncbi:glycerate-and formate-dehydrogenase [Mycena sanguinolenta]|nr:glycerate-and formate-dehydrogenase [Mycena sanguinolenta]